MTDREDQRLQFHRWLRLRAEYQDPNPIPDPDLYSDGELFAAMLIAIRGADMQLARVRPAPYDVDTVWLENLTREAKVRSTLLKHNATSLWSHGEYLRLRELAYERIQGKRDTGFRHSLYSQLFSQWIIDGEFPKLDLAGNTL